MLLNAKNDAILSFVKSVDLDPEVKQQDFCVGFFVCVYWDVSPHP